MAHPWEPTLTQVAGYVPWLTVDATTPGSQAWLGTFTTVTVPTDAQAQQHITDAASLVGIGLTDVATTLYPTAATVTALLAAASLVRAYPRRSTDTDDLALAAAWEARAALALTALIGSANDPGNTPTPLAPVLYAPEPVEWGDDLFLGTSTRYPRTYVFPE